MYQKTTIYVLFSLLSLCANCVKSQKSKVKESASPEITYGTTKAPLLTFHYKEEMVPPEEQVNQWHSQFDRVSDCVDRMTLARSPADQKKIESECDAVFDSDNYQGDGLYVALDPWSSSSYGEYLYMIEIPAGTPFVKKAPSIKFDRSVRPYKWAQNSLGNYYAIVITLKEAVARDRIKVFGQRKEPSSYFDGNSCSEIQDLSALSEKLIPSWSAEDQEVNGMVKPFELEPGDFRTLIFPFEMRNLRSPQERNLDPKEMLRQNFELGYNPAAAILKEVVEEGNILNFPSPPELYNAMTRFFTHRFFKTWTSPEAQKQLKESKGFRPEIVAEFKRNVRQIIIKALADRNENRYKNISLLMEEVIKFPGLKIPTSDEEFTEVMWEKFWPFMEKNKVYTMLGSNRSKNLQACYWKFVDLQKKSWEEAMGNQLSEQ
jgi:hypothetical protein